MNSFRNNMNFLRYGNNFDYSKVPVISKKMDKLKLDTELTPSNWIEELRVSNFVKNPPRPKIVLGLDELEINRRLLYGERVDIQPEKLAERFGSMVVQVPSRRADGTVIHDPPLPENQRSRHPVSGRNAVLQNMTFREVLNNPQSLLYRINQLLINANVSTQQLARENRALLDQNASEDISLSEFRDDIRNELAIIKRALLEDILEIPSVTRQGQEAGTPDHEAREQSLRAVFTRLAGKETEKIQANLDADVPVIMDPREIIDKDHISPRGIATYSIISNRYSHLPGQRVLPAYSHFVMRKLSKMTTINLSEALDLFESTGGPDRWFQIAKGITLPVTMGTAAIGEEDEQEEEFSSVIEEEKKEEKKEELFEINARAIFEDSGIFIPKNGESLDSEWYHEHIQIKEKKKGKKRVNFGNRQKFMDVIDEIRSKSNNLGYASFPQNLSNKTIVNHIQGGNAEIMLEEDDNFVYEKF